MLSNNQKKIIIKTVAKEFGVPMPKINSKLRYVPLPEARFVVAELLTIFGEQEQEVLRFMNKRHPWLRQAHKSLLRLLEEPTLFSGKFIKCFEEAHRLLGIEPINHRAYKYSNDNPTKDKSAGACSRSNACATDGCENKTNQNNAASHGDSQGEPGKPLSL